MTPFSAPLHASGRAGDLPPLGHWLDLVGMALCLAVLALAAYGCEPTKHYDSDKGAFVSSSSSDAATTGAHTNDKNTLTPGGDANTSNAPTTVAASDSAPSGPVAWCYGGFNGSRAAHDPRCRISSLRVHNPSGLSLKWETGVPADWAQTGGLVVCALFFQTPSGSWKGGKIDWINPARSTRDLKNPAAGYGGWNWSEYLAAKKHAFVIVSADGLRRSNWIFD